MNDENLNVQIKAFCEKINNVLKKKRNFVKKVGIIDDKDVVRRDMENSETSLAEIPLEQNETMGKIKYKTTINNWKDIKDSSNIYNGTLAKIQVVNYSKQHNDINSFPDEMLGEIVLNLGFRMRIIYNTDNDTVVFWILDISQEKPWRLYVYKEIKVDKGVNEDDIKDIITAMQQENAGQQSFEKRAIKLSNVIQRDPFVESNKRSHIIKYKAQVEALKEKEQKLLSLFNKKIKIQNENTKKYFERWQNNTRKMSDDEICGIDCGYLKCNDKWCGCI